MVSDPDFGGAGHFEGIPLKIEKNRRSDWNQDMRAKEMGCVSGRGLTILNVFPMTERLLANMAKTAIRGFNTPATARGIPSPL